MSTIQAITNIVDLLLAWFMATLIVVPYITSVMKTDPNENPLLGLGEVYRDIFYIGIRFHLVESLSVCAILFFLAAMFHVFAAALCVWAFQAAYLIHVSIKKGYRPKKR